MAEEASVHPGSWLGDATEEFKKLPPAGKIAVVAGFILVAGIGYYEYNKSKSTSSGVSGQASPSTDLSGAGANQYPTVPGGNTGQVPVLPGGLQPLYDPQGNLIGFEPTGTSGTTTTGTTGTGTTTTGGKGTKGGKGKGTKGTKNTGHGGSSSGHGGSQGTGGTHTVKQHQANGSQHKPSISNSGHSQPTPNNKVSSIQPKNTFGSHGYVYTTQPGDTLQSLQAKFFRTSNASNAQGNIINYGNNRQIFAQKGVISGNSQIKPGTKILA